MAAAAAWKGRMDWEGGAEAVTAADGLGLLLLVGAYGVPEEFEAKFMGELWRSSNARKKAEIFRHSPFLVRKVPEIIEDLSKNNKHATAAEFIVAFKLEDKYPLLPLFSSLLESVGIENGDGSNLHKSTEEVAKEQRDALEAVDKFLKDHKLDPKTFASLKIDQKLSRVEEEISELNNQPQDKTLKRKSKEIEGMNNSMKTQVEDRNVKRKPEETGHKKNPVKPLVEPLQSREEAPYVPPVLHTPHDMPPLRNIPSTPHSLGYSPGSAVGFGEATVATDPRQFNVGSGLHAREETGGTDDLVKTQVGDGNLKRKPEETGHTKNPVKPLAEPLQSREEAPYMPPLLPTPHGMPLLRNIPTMPHSLGYSPGSAVGFGVAAVAADLRQFNVGNGLHAREETGGTNNLVETQVEDRNLKRKPEETGHTKNLVKPLTEPLQSREEAPYMPPLLPTPHGMPLLRNIPTMPHSLGYSPGSAVGFGAAAVAVDPRQFNARSGLAAHPRQFNAGSGIAVDPRQFNAGSGLAADPMQFFAGIGRAADPRQFNAGSGLAADPRLFNAGIGLAADPRLFNAGSGLHARDGSGSTTSNSVGSYYGYYNDMSFNENACMGVSYVHILPQTSTSSPVVGSKVGGSNLYGFADSVM